MDGFLTQVSDSPELKRKLPGMQKFRTDLLNKALAYYREFLAQHGDETNFREEAVNACFRVAKATGEIGRADESRAAFEKGLAILNELATSGIEASQLHSSARKGTTG